MEVVRFAEILLVISIVEAFTCSIILQLPPLSVVDILTVASKKIRVIYVLSPFLC